MTGYMYILKYSNGAYYIGSTNDLELRLQQHQNCEGANFTKKHLPVELVYFEEFQRIDEAFKLTVKNSIEILLTYNEESKSGKE
ncbi:MAG: GIY-YIG nuclease family protein [Bacteroidia bacterium]